MWRGEVVDVKPDKLCGSLYNIRMENGINPKGLVVSFPKGIVPKGTRVGSKVMLDNSLRIRLCDEKKALANLEKICKKHSIVVNELVALTADDLLAMEKFGFKTLNAIRDELDILGLKLEGD